MKETAALYCRLSVEDEYKKGESESIQNQKLLLLDYAKKQNWDVFCVYCDEDYSGLDDNRPAFLQMLEDAEKGKFSVICCKTQSRFTRNMETAEHYLHYKFVLWKIRFVTIVDHVDTDSIGNKKARQINGLVNEWYCEEISENIRAVFRKKMELGQFIGPYACYGYEKSSQDKHRLIIDENSACVVRDIYNWYLEGKSVAQIAKKLTITGVPTPWEYKKAKGIDNNRKNVKHPGVWSENTVRKILKNEMYTGCVIQGKERKLSYKTKKVIAMPKNEWIIVQNTHEPIIQKERFQTVQNKMKRKP